MHPRTLTRLQAGSGLVLSIFVALHLINLFSANLGPEVYNQVQRIFRVVYQQPLFEIFGLLGALLLHMVTGVAQLVLRRRKRRATPGPRSKQVARWPLRFHRWSAYYLVLTVLGHFAATRGMSLVYGVWPEFEGVGFAIWWLPWVFYPYYFLLAMSGAYHLVYGWARACAMLGRPWFRSPSETMLKRGALACALAVVGALLCFGGLTHSTPDPTDHDYARVYAREMGVQLPD